MRLSTTTYGKTTLEDVSFSDASDSGFNMSIVKNWLKVTTSADDTLIANLIDETISQFQEMLNCSIVSQTVTAEYSEYGREVKLPYGPVTELTTVKKRDKGNLETIESDDYYLIGDRLVFNTVETSEDPFYKMGLQVVYSAGYSTIPAGLQQAILQAITTNYVDREDNAMDRITKIPSNSRKKAMKWRRF